jgi:hypothetical protein
MITSDRNVFLGAHLTQEQKNLFRKEAERRKISMSELLSHVLEEWLIIAPAEQVEEFRSNKRFVKETVQESIEKTIDGLREVELPFGINNETNN